MTLPAGSKRIRLSNDPEKIRAKLFEAGWHPSMVGLPITDKRINDLLLELNDALREKTMRRLKRL